MHELCGLRELGENAALRKYVPPSIHGREGQSDAGCSAPYFSSRHILCESQSWT